MFNMGTTPAFNMPTGGLIPNQQQAFPNAGMSMPAMMLSSEAKQQEDVRRLLSIYMEALEPNSDKNRFRGCLYNKI